MARFLPIRHEREGISREISGMGVAMSSGVRKTILSLAALAATIPLLWLAGEQEAPGTEYLVCREVSAERRVIWRGAVSSYSRRGFYEYVVYPATGGWFHTDADCVPKGAKSRSADLQFSYAGVKP